MKKTTQNMKTIILYFLILVSHCQATFYLPEDRQESKDFLVFFSSQYFTNANIYESRSGDLFGDYTDIVSGYLEILEAYTQDPGSIQAHLSETFKHNRFGVDAFGRIDAQTDLRQIEIKDISSYGNTHFMVLAIDGKGTFVNLVVEDGQVKLTNKTLRDGQTFGLLGTIGTRYVQSSINELPDRFYHYIPMYNPDPLNVRGLKDSILSLKQVSEIGLPAILVRNIEWFCDTSLEELLADPSRIERSEIYEALKVLNETSQLAKDEKEEAFLAKWASSEKDRIAKRLNHQGFRASLFYNYRLAPNIAVKAAILLSEDSGVFYLGEDGIKYLLKESGEWRLAESEFWSSNIRNVLDGEELRSYLNLGCAGDGIQEQIKKILNLDL